MKWCPECETSQRNKVSSDRSETPRCTEKEAGDERRNAGEGGTKTPQGGRERGGGGKEDVNKWKSSAGHVSRRGVRQVSTGMKTNDEGTCGNALLIVWSGGRCEFNVKEKCIN